MKTKEIEEVEVDLLVNGILQRYGYDFRNYARSSLRRRIARRVTEAGLRTISDLLARLMHDEALFDEFLADMSVTVTKMFRDPLFFKSVREHVVPFLKTRPLAKIWHAGCATGQEVYSMAILLHEEDCLDRCKIYATDYNNRSLATASKGTFPLEPMREYAANYYEAGGKADFSDYFCARYGFAKFSDALKQSITFAHHNLVENGPFADMDLIVCRNVLIYFDQTLQSHVFKVFVDSLSESGMLCLGSRETLNISPQSRQFEPVSKDAKIFRKASPSPSNEAREVVAV